MENLKTQIEIEIEKEKRKSIEKDFALKKDYADAFTKCMEKSQHPNSMRKVASKIKPFELRLSHLHLIDVRASQHNTMCYSFR